MLKKPRKAVSAVGALRRKNDWQCEIPAFGIILFGMKNPGAGGWLWDQEAQKVAAALAVLFLHSALVLIPVHRAMQWCPLCVPPLLPRFSSVPQWALTAYQIQELLPFIEQAPSHVKLRLLTSIISILFPQHLNKA